METLSYLKIHPRDKEENKVLLLRGERRVKRNAVPVRSAEEKICIERAKELLISRYGMSEGQAHRFLQKKSMDSGIKMLHTAQMVLEESGRF